MAVVASVKLQVQRKEKGKHNSWAIPHQLVLVWKPAGLRLWAPALGKLAGLCSPHPPAALVTAQQQAACLGTHARHEVRTVFPIIHQEEGCAGNSPWRALGRGSLPRTARYLLQMLTGNTTTKGLECFHLREGSRKSTWSSSSHLKLRFLERARWFHKRRRSGFQTVLQEASLKENQTSSSGSSKKLIFHLS